MRGCTIIQLIIVTYLDRDALLLLVCVYPVVLLSLAWGEGWHDDLHLLGESMDLRRHYDGAGVGFQALYVVELPTSSRIAFKHVLYNEDTDAL